MIINFNGNITDLKNTYMAEVKRLQEKEANFRVVLTFSEAVALHQSKYRKDDIVADRQEVKRLTFSDGRCSNCMWDNTEAKDVFYTAGKARRSGWYLPHQVLTTVEVLEQPTKDYGKEWQAIANSCKKYGINARTVTAIEKHLAGETDHIEGFQNWWKRTQKPRTMSFADVLRRFGHAKIETGKSYSIQDYRKAEIDSINETAIESMKKLAKKTEYGDYLYYHAVKFGTKRDRSVSIQVYPNGEVRYYSASEFAGCGNGDYYEMYSPTMAFYAESD